MIDAGQGRIGPVLGVLLAVTLAGCLAPGQTPVDSGPPWEVHIATTHRVCWTNHDGSRVWDPDTFCRDPLDSPSNTTDLPNGTPAKGPDLYLEVGRAPGPGYGSYPNVSFHEPSWNYSTPCPFWSPSYSIRAQHNRCDDHPVRERVVVPPLGNASEEAAWRANRSEMGHVAERPWTAVYPFTGQGELTLVLHRPVELSLEVMGEYPAAYKEMMRVPGACKEGVPEERQEMFAPGAGGKTWGWSMSGAVAYESKNLHGIDPIYRRISNEVVVTGDAEITLAWDGACIGGQY